MRSLLLNFMLRVVLGTLAMYLCNTLFSSLGVEIYLGINVLNLLTVGSLGFSGFVLVLAVASFSLL